MTRGQVSKKLQINPETLRYYENIGLIAPAFGSNQYRFYDDVLVDKIELILKFKALGFSLKEIRRFFDLIGSSTDDPKRFNHYLTHKIVEIEKQIEGLRLLKQSLILFRDKEDRETCSLFSKYIKSS